MIRSIAETDTVAETAMASPASLAATRGPVDHPAPDPASTRLGRYVIIDEIGRGGMGVVQRAYDPRLQREVALKSVRRDGLGPQTQIDLLQEALAMAKLSHPNIVAVYDVEVEGASVIIAMEYVRGTTLRAWLAEEGRHWRDVVETFIAAGRGLAAAHAAGMLHRDFKPANVFIGVDGRVRVGDFGVAEAQGPATASDLETSDGSLRESTIIAGTPRYMAPEQHQGGPLSPATDQFAFCISLWEGLTRQRCFANADSKLRGSPPPWPRDVAVPSPIREALVRGLATEPADRWPSMELLLQALTQASRQRRSTRLLLASLLVPMALGGLAWATYHQQLAKRCSGAVAALADAWNAERRDAVQAAFAATDSPIAGETWRNVAPQLDDYASGWVGKHTEICESTTVRGEQTSEDMDLRMTCLHRAKVDLRAVSGLFLQPDAQIIEKAHDLVAGLPALAHCDDLDALRTEVEPPPPDEQTAVESIRAELAEVKALREAGKYPQLVSRIQEIHERVARIAYPPLHTEVLVELGLAHDLAGTESASEDALRQALRAALTSKQWREAQFAATHLIRVVGGGQARPAAALAYAETAKGLLARVEPSVEADVRSHIGGTLNHLGRYREAEAEHRAAVAIAEHIWGEDDLRAASFRESLGLNLNYYQKREAEAEEEFRTVLLARKRVLGPEHPSVATAHYHLANALSAQDRLAEAESELLLVREIQTKVLGAQHPATAVTRQALALVLDFQGRYEEALPEFEASLSIMIERLEKSDVGIIAARGNLARTLIALDRHTEAEAQLRLALAASVERDHLQVVGVHIILSMLLNRQQRYREAEVEARAGVMSLRKSVDEKHPDMIVARSHLGASLNGLGRFEEALVELRAARQFALALYGPRDGRQALMLSQIGSISAAQGRHTQAEAELREALAALLSADRVSPPSWAIAARSRLANFLRAQRRHAEAEAEYREALAAQAALTEDDHPDVASLQSGLARTLLESGRPRRALPIYARSWKLWGDDARVEAASRAQIAFGLARTLWKTSGDRERARSLAATARELFELTPGVNKREQDELRRWLRDRGGSDDRTREADDRGVIPAK